MAEGRFVAYYRVSTAEQRRSGLGLDAQREAVRGYLNGGNWYLLAEHRGRRRQGKQSSRDGAGIGNVPPDGCDACDREAGSSQP